MFKQPLSVLVVEDEAADFELLVHGLERSGIDAHCQRVDTEEAFSNSLRNPPDVILSDYAVPSCGALYALEQVAASGLDIPVIVITGTVSEETVVESMKHGAADYLLKDRMTRLGPAVKRALRDKELRAEARRAEEDAIRQRLLKDAAEARASVAEELARSNAELHEVNLRLKETQAQLIQNEKMASLGQLVAGIAHEINNPLAFVLNNLFLIESALEALAQEMEAHLSEASLRKLRKAWDRLREMRAGLDRVKELVLDLRVFSRLDEAEVSTIDIGEAIDSVLLLLSHKMAGRIEVEKRYLSSRPADCYAGPLRQVLMNLIANAVDAIVGQGTIFLTTSETADCFRISIRDTGSGIPEEIRDKIFDPFFTTKPVGQGTGLGLSIAYGIVQDHGGSIEVKSEEGAGTEFILKLPLELKCKRGT